MNQFAINSNNPGYSVTTLISEGFKVIKGCILLVIFLFLGLLTVQAQCPDHTTNVCDGQRTTVDVDTLPFCDEGGATLEGDIFQQLNCEDTNGFNCYEFKFIRQENSATESFTFDVGQGQGCTGELDASYFVYDGVSCQQLSTGGSQTNITFPFPDGINEIFLYLCINSNAQVTMCDVCRERPPCTIDVACQSISDIIGNYCEGDVCDIPQPTTVISDVFVQNEVCDFDVIMESSDSGETDCVDANANDQIDIIRTYTLKYFDIGVNDFIVIQSCDQNITLLSENCCVAPQVFCPSDTQIQCDESSDPAFTGEATFSEGCGDVNITFNDSFQADCGNTGIITRTWTATDQDGNTVSCDQLITIVDDTPPVLSDPSPLTDISCTDQFPAQETLIGSDNCSSVTITPSVDAFTEDLCAGYSVTYRWVAEDACGNTSFKTVSFNVLPDSEGPELSGVPADADVPCESIPSPPQVTANDACSGAVDVSFSEEFVNLSECLNGVILRRTWSATDSCGNISVETQDINLIDTTPPEISCPDDLEIQCFTQDPTWETTPEALSSFASALEVCSGAAELTYSDVINDSDCGYTIVRTWSAVDACGNESSCTQNILVVDNIAPVLFNVPANDAVECDNIPAVPTDIFALDECDEEIIVDFDETNTPGNCPNSFTVLRTWTATDACGNSISESQTINVTDTTPPTITCPPDVQIDCGDSTAPGATGTATASDNCQGNVTITFTDESTGDCGCGITQIITRTWRATDVCGLFSECVQTITVEGYTNPTVSFTALADLCIDAGVQTGLGGGSPTGGVYSGPGVTDDGNGETYSFDPAAAGVGTHTITYSYTDNNGCSSSASDDVEVFALPTVTFTALADLCIDAGVQAGLGGGTPTGGVYSGPGVTDDGNGMTYSFDPAAAGAGTHTITYTYTNANGCTDSASDDVEVFSLPDVRFTAPADLCIDAGVQAGLGGGTPTGGVYSGTGVTDDGNGQTYSFDPAAAGVGTHTITYSFTDNNGCSSSASDDIEVFALPTVTFTALADLCIDAGVQAGLGGGTPTGGVYSGPGVTDDGNGMTYSFDPAAAGVGTHTITYTFSGGNGCTDSASDDVEMFSLPVVTYTAPADLCIDAGVQAGLGGGTPTGGVYSGPGVTDDGNGMTYSFDPAAAGVGTHSITYSFTDNNGCSSSASDDIEVFDIPDANAEGGELTCAITSIQIFGSSSTVGVTYSWTGPNAFASDEQNPIVSEEGLYTLTVTVAATGCSNTATALVTSDTQAPTANAGAEQELTCVITEVTLDGSGSSSNPDADLSYTWSGPNNFTADTEDATVSEPGTYILTVTDNDNGCSAMSSVDVNIDDTKPSASAGVDTELTCTTTEVTLDGSGSSTNPDADLSYLWSGPEGFSASTKDITVSIPGTYVLTVTDNDNGCTAESDVNVGEDIEAPIANAGADAVLTCSMTEVLLDGSGSSSNPDADLSYSWSGPNGFSALTEDVIVDEIGVYTLTVTDNDNGCSASSNVTVTKEVIELIISKTDVTCFGLNDGTILVEFVTEGATVTVDGEPYNPDTLYGPGEYTVMATFEGNDDPDCTTSELITIVEPAEVELELESTNVTCFGANDGTITILSLSEGASYTIKLNGTGPDLSGQSTFGPGAYVVEAFLDTPLGRQSMDSKSNRIDSPCVDGQLVIIEEPEPIICNIIKLYSGHPYCGGKKGFGLEVDVENGVGNLTYSWELIGDSGKLGWVILSDTDTSGIVFNPGPGSGIFQVAITDENGCSATCELEIKSNCDGNLIAGTEFYLPRQGPFDFEMVPNPSKGKVVLKPNRVNDDSITVEVFNLVGTRLVNTKLSETKDLELQLDLSHLPSQVYYVRVTTKGESKIKKLVIDR